MMKKIISIMLLAGILTGVFSGCGKQEAKDQSGEEVVVNWVMPGPGKQADAEEVWSEFNKRLKTYEGLENVSVNFEVIEANDYVQKFLMAQTGGDKMDIIQTYTLDFAKEARNGTFAPLDDYFDNELKETKEELPEFIFEYGRVDDGVYSVTNYQMCPSMWALNINKELADKYIDINELRAAAAKKDFSPELFDIIEKLLEETKRNGEMGQGFSPYYATILASRTFDTVVSNFALDMYAQKPEIEEIHKTEEYKFLYDKMRDWFLKGYIRKDILSNDKVVNDNGKADGNIIFIENNYLGHDVETRKNSKIDHYVVYLPANPLIPPSNAAGSLAISANSENKEAAAKIINLMNCERGKDLYNLLVWGLEGKHYNKTGEDSIETIGYSTQGTSSTPYGQWKWIIGNTKNSYITQTEASDYKDFVFNKFNEGENTMQSRVLGIKVDLNKYQSGYSQLSSVVKEYNNPLMYGAVENYEQVYDEFMQKIDACGYEEIKAEIQRQIDEFLASKN